MLSLLLSIIALGFIVTVHEFGHFLFAKLFGVGVVEFSLGMGPRIASFVRGETRYSLRLFPFGGSCMMIGEDEDETEEDEAAEQIEIDGRFYPKSAQFSEKPAWQRFLIVFAGPCFNFLLAFAFSLVLTWQAGYDRPVLAAVDAGTAAEESGLSAGDVLTGIETGGKKSRIETSRDLSLFLTLHADALSSGEEIRISYRDASDGFAKKTAVLVPRYDAQSGSMRMGFRYNTAYEPAENAGALIRYSVYNVKYCMKATAVSLQMIAKGQAKRDDVMGPVRMVAVMDETVSEAADYGVWATVMTLLNMMILISGSLGAMNLLPIPALDGGRLFFLLIELIARRRLPARFEQYINAAGMALLLLFMVLVLLNDILFLL